MVNWLHLSDIHVGQSEQKWLWPTAKTLFFDDLARLAPKHGPIDFIIFSGDVTQKGSASEFGLLDDVLGEIQEACSTYGGDPKVIPAPGNHDLARPESSSVIEAALRQSTSDPSILDRVFSDGASEYRDAIFSMFENYETWLARGISSGLVMQPAHRGVLPGDASFRLTKAATEIAIVTLNSAWLQVGPGDYKERLCVDPRQLLAVTAGDPSRWLSDNDLSLLVTHHPPDWLAPAARSLWDSDIIQNGRFDVHLFGHMHEHVAKAESLGAACF